MNVLKKKDLHPTVCPLCGSSKKADEQVLYKANFSLQTADQLFSARRLPDRMHYQLVRCKRDDMVRSTPILSAKVLSQLYKKSAFTYENEVPQLTKTYLIALENVLPHLKKTANILEIGCGPGFILSALYQKGFHRVQGIEPSVHAAQLADPKIKKNIFVGSFPNKHFRPHTFDCIFFFQTLDHIPDPNRFLAACFSLLRPGGYILSFHHNVESFSAKILGEKSPIIDIEHTHLYSFETTKKMFKKNHFSVKKIYAPLNTLSCAHLLWLLPIPTKMKKIFLGSFSVLQHLTVQLPLGNICVVAQRPKI